MGVSFLVQCLLAFTLKDISICIHVLTSHNISPRLPPTFHRSVTSIKISIRLHLNKPLANSYL